MLTISKVISTFVDSTKRKIKVYLTGTINVQSAHQIAPHGIDSNPIEGMKAIYGATQVNGRPVIIGYINPNVLADTGETRLYSTNAAGVLKNYLWLKNDGTIEIGGSDDFMVRFSKLKEVTDELQNDLTTLKNVFSTWTPVSNDGGAALKLAAATWYGTPISKDINEAKIAEIKTS